MASCIAILGCLDTKGEEVGFLKTLVERLGASTHIVDVGVLGEPAFLPDTDRKQVAQAGGAELDTLRRQGDRGAAIETMAQGAESIVAGLCARGEIDGVLAAGGSANTTVATQAMRALPVGFPKLMVSTLASGNTAPYVDTRDITMMYSVVDIAGINRISERILTNAAVAITAMATTKTPASTSGKPIVAATMFGVTTPCVTSAKARLEDAGYEVIVFHATGTGGRAMEGLIKDGYIAGVLDVTTTELADELVGGVLSAGSERLTVAATHGIPQVVSTGAVDMVNFGPSDTVPERFATRKFYKHNPTVTLMRTTPAENAAIGERIATRLNASTGPAAVVLPLRGVSAISGDEGVFCDHDADNACFDAIRQNLREGIRLEAIDAEINDEEFARVSADLLMKLMKDRGPT